MNAKLSIFTGLTLKALIIICILNGFVNVDKCSAQSVVGKWKQVSGKMFCTPEAVKNSHGHLQDVMEMPKVNAIDEFNADNTLKETITSGGTVTTSSGTWVLLGNSVKISINGQKKMTGIVSGNGTTLVFTVEMPKAEHIQVSKREWTYSKM